MILATLNKDGELVMHTDIEITTTTVSIIATHKYCTNQLILNFKEILDGYRSITSAMADRINLVYLVNDLKVYTGFIIYNNDDDTLSVYGCCEDDESFRKLDLEGDTKVFSNLNEATSYADYTYNIIRRNEILEKIHELNDELHSVEEQMISQYKVFIK